MVTHAGRQSTLKGKAGPSEPFCSGFWCRAGRRHGVSWPVYQPAARTTQILVFCQTLRNHGNHMNGSAAYFSAECDNLRACQTRSSATAERMGQIDLNGDVRQMGEDLYLGLKCSLSDKTARLLDGNALAPRAIVAQQSMPPPGLGALRRRAWRAFGRANEQCGACRTCLGHPRPPRPLADCRSCCGSLRDVAVKLDGLARTDRRCCARPAAVPAVVGLLRQRDGAIFPLSHLAEDGR